MCATRFARSADLRMPGGMKKPSFVRLRRRRLADADPGEIGSDVGEPVVVRRSAGSRCTTLVHCWYPEVMGTKTKAASGRSVRQSVTMPATLAAQVRRVAKERKVTVSRALVDLAERGVRAEAEAKQQLKAAYRNFVQQADPERKNEAGRDLIRAIFGKDSMAEDSVL